MARVIAPWQASYTPALSVTAGEAVRVGGTDPENPGWVWCVNGAGLGGWLPAACVQDGKATEAFDTAELTVHGGEDAHVLARYAGWSMCRLADGREGWLPDSCLEG